MYSCKYSWRTYFLLFLLFAFARGAFPQSITATLPPPSVPLPSLTQWLPGTGTLTISSSAYGYRLRVSDKAEYGNCFVEGEINLDQTPYLVLQTTQVEQGTHWQLSVNDPEAHLLEKDGMSVGLHAYDLRQVSPTFQGRKRFRIYLTVQGRAQSLTVGGIGFYRTWPAPKTEDGVPVTKWEHMNGAKVTITPDGTDVDQAVVNGDVWAGVISKVMVDTDQFPLLEATVNKRAPNSHWRVSIANTTPGPDFELTGTVTFNYHDFSTWRGNHLTELNMTWTRIGGDKGIQIGPVHFVRYPSASRTLVSRAEHALEADATKQSHLLLTTGNIQVFWNPTTRLFSIGRKSGQSFLMTRLLEMPGYDPIPLGNLKPVTTKTGTKIEYVTVSNGISFTVLLETVSGSPGLLHWRVTATPKQEVTFPSCGHELVFVSPDDAMLRRIMVQNLTACPSVFTTLPGLGTALYFQNFTALNPLFEKCHTLPRYLVNAGNNTLGFANTMNTEVKFEAGKSLILADTYLQLTTKEILPQEEGEDNIVQSEQFLKSLAAIYSELPDRPETEWYDWQKLARLSLRDLQHPACWRAYGSHNYLQAYVGVRGCVPQITSLQDILAPLSDFRAISGGEGTALITPLVQVVPDFWSEERKTLKVIAMPGDHTWFDTATFANIARAALSGNPELKEWALKSADTMIHIAHVTNYRFPDEVEGLPKIAPNTVGKGYRLLNGTYLLYMMLCHELDSTNPRYLTEAKQAAIQVRRFRYDEIHEVFAMAMTCEGLARLYEVTHDPQYVRDSLVPLACLMRNVFWWESDMGYAKHYTTFGGMNPDSSGIDYIAPMEQHQSYYGLFEYYRRLQDVLPPSARLLTAEFLRYVPGTIWYTYPPNAPKESLYSGETFWKTDNAYALYIPMEDMSIGWTKNATVGQEIYGAGAAFTIASHAYVAVPDAKLLLFSEYPVRDVVWDKVHQSLTFRVGGESNFPCKLEIRPLILQEKTIVPVWQDFTKVKGLVQTRTLPNRPAIPITMTVLPQTDSEKSVNLLRATVPGDTVVQLFVGTLPPPPPTGTPPIKKSVAFR